MKFSQNISAGYTLGAINEIVSSDLLKLQRSASRFSVLSNTDLSLRDSTPDQKQLFSVLNNLISRGFPTYSSIYQERSFGSLYGEELGFLEVSDDEELKFHLSKNEDELLKEASVLVDPRLKKITKPVEEFQGSKPAKTLFDSLPDFLKHFTQPERLFTDGVVLREKDGQFYRRQVDFAIETPTGLKWIIEVDGSQHSQLSQQLIDKYRNEALYESGWNILRIPTSVTDFSDPVFDDLQKDISKDKTISYARKLYREPLWNSKKGLNALQMILGPIAVARCQSALCRAILSGNIDLEKKKLRIFCIEQDVSFAVIALEDFFQTISALSKLSGIECPIPEIILDIKVTSAFSLYNNERQEIHKEYVSACHFVDEKEVSKEQYDIIIDLSMLQKIGLQNSKDNTHQLHEAGIQLQIRSDFNCSPVANIEGFRPIHYPNVEVEALVVFLQNLFRKKAFRDGQVNIMRRALSGQDTIGLLPTGSGKSLCYQLATLLQPGISMIIEPLKALMVDQHRNLKNNLIDHCVYINSDIDAQQRKEIEQRWARSEYQYIWISPERLQIKEFRGYLQMLTRKMPIIYAVIDEAHCVSEWGHDFRTSYLMMSRTIRKYCEFEGYKPIFYGLTATASETVLKDIEIELVKNSQGDPKIKPNTFDRSELNFSIYSCESSQKFEFFKEAISEICSTFDINTQDLFKANGTKTRAGLVFCPHVNKTDFSISELSAKIAAEYNFQQHVEIKEQSTPLCPTCNKDLVRRSGNFGEFWGCTNYPKCRYTEAVTSGKIQYYDRMHIFGGRPVDGFDKGSWDEYKIKAQDEFIDNKAPLMISTKAFGMGIDKPNIRYTIHYNIPSSLEAFYQEAGRAGRDKQDAVNIILFSDDSKEDSRERLSTKKSANEVRQMKRLSRGKEGDVHRMLFFQSMSFKGFEEELNRIREILNFELYESYSTLKEGETCEVIIEEKGGNTEKALYRLSLIGLIEDYTIEFSHPRFYQVLIKKLPFESHVHILYSYIRRHGIPQQDSVDLRKHLDSKEAFFEYIESLDYNHHLTKCCAVLLEYIYATIEPQRRRALLNLVNALESGDPNVFRKNMLRYLSPDEEFNELFESFPDTYGHDTIDGIFKKASTEDAKNKLLGITLRYLESYPSNPGLLILASGLRLSLPDETLKSALDDFEASRTETDIFNTNEEVLIYKSLINFLFANASYYPSAITDIVLRCSDTLQSSKFDAWIYDESPFDKLKINMASNLTGELSLKTKKLISKIKG